MFKKIMLSMAASAIKPDVENLRADFNNINGDPPAIVQHHLAVISTISDWPNTIGPEYANFINLIIKTPKAHFGDAQFKSIAIVAQELFKYTSLSNGQITAFGSRFWRANLMAMQMPSLHPLMFDLWQTITIQERSFLDGAPAFYNGPTLVSFRPLIYTLM